MPGSRHLARATLLLVAFSSVLVQAALRDRQPTPESGYALLACSAALAAAMRWASRRSYTAAWRPNGVAMSLSLAALPVAWDAGTRGILGVGDPYEVQLAYVLRNLMFAVAAWPGDARSQRYAALASFFLVLFGFLWTVNAWTLTLAVLYAIVGMGWLMEAYWDPLGGRFADSDESPRPPMRAAATALSVVALVALASTPLATSTSHTTALDGFFPSSGGTRQCDSFALGGVGNGDQMVAAQDHASSFGPIESGLFLESEMPSLYDAFNELSETVPETKKRFRRAIPLAPGQTQANHQERGLTQQATREFSAVRQTTRKRTAGKDLRSTALLLVRGRTPMHLGLEAYDHWDGRSLRSASSGETPELRLSGPDGQGTRWLKLPAVPAARVFPATSESQVRVVNLRTRRVPAPPNTTAVTIDGLHSAAMFCTASDGALAMDVEHIPQLTILRIKASLRDRSAEPQLCGSPPPAGASTVSRLASSWTEGLPSGWPQVEAIVRRLRSEYVHDPAEMAPDSEEDVVEHFLTTSRRGPDYLFATSAAVMLRSLGYETRVRSGFYVGPGNFDRVSRLTPVTAEDAHFWVEVLSREGTYLSQEGEAHSGAWIAVEPTPGYELLYAPETFVAWAGRHARWFYRAAAERPLTSIAGCAAVTGALLKRKLFMDAALVALWLIGAPWGGVRRRALLALRLLEWRAWVHRRQRPSAVPLSRWAPLVGQDDFLAVVSWALYGEGTPPPLRAEAANSACSRAARLSLGTTRR